MTLEEAQELVQKYPSFSFIGKWLMSKKYKKALEIVNNL